MRSLSLRAAVATRMRLWDQIRRALRGPRQTQNFGPAHDPNRAEAARQVGLSFIIYRKEIFLSRGDLDPGAAFTRAVRGNFFTSLMVCERAAAARCGGGH